MTSFPGKCSVVSCPFNLGNGRVACDWLRNGRGRCHHYAYREAWALAYELDQAQAGDLAPILAAMATAQPLVAGDAEMQEPPARPLSLTGRAAAADAPMSSERARQMLLDLGEV